MLEQALALHRQGRLPEAEQAYRAILAREPGNAAVGHLLGTLALDAGMPEHAAPILERVCMLAPANPAAHTDLGIACFQLGRAAEALKSFDQALALDPGFFSALHHKGVALMESAPQEALEHLDRAIASQPDSASTHNFRALVLTHLVRLEEALASFRKACDLNPDNPMAHSNVGFALVKLGRLEDAVAAMETAVALAPEDSGLHYNLGGVFRTLGRQEEALAAYDKALTLKPNMVDAYVNRGLTHTDLGAVEQALTDFDNATLLDPELMTARIGRSDALVKADRIDEALAYDRELARNPRFKPDAEFHSAFLLLQRGDWAEGWKLYEARRHKEDPTETRSYPKSEWLGEGEISGKTLYVYAEQGLGDIIQFSRYLGLAAARGARVIFSPQDKLARLMQSLRPRVEILPYKTAPEQFDLHMPLMSMPLAFGTRPETIPAEIPYLAAEPALVEKWRQRIGDQGFRIGICWMGSANTGMGIDRSFPLAALAPIAALPGVRLISLQKIDGLEQLDRLPAGMQVETLGDDFDAGDNGFVDSAAAIETLDLVISCDTSVAHLAGALGRPCWTALKHRPEWRWGLSGDTTPWYPGMRLFRQQSNGDWGSVFDAMAARLKAQLPPSSQASPSSQAFK